MDFRQNLSIKQRNLEVVNRKVNYKGSLGSILNAIKRSKVSERILICALVSPDNSKAIFLDDKGHEYLIESKDYKTKLNYISEKFVKKSIRKYSKPIALRPSYQNVIKSYVKRPDVIRKYKGWKGLQPSIQISEESMEDKNIYLNEDTNSSNIEGKVDQNMANKSEYKWLYCDPDKNKKLGMISRGNVNHCLYNLLWGIISHQSTNDEARHEIREVEWLLKRFPKDEDRDDDTGVSNETINKYVKKARDIVNGMKPEKVDEDLNEDTVVNGFQVKKIHDDKGDHWQVLKDGVLQATYESEEAAKNAINGKKLSDINEENVSSWNDVDNDIKYRYNYDKEEIEISDGSEDVYTMLVSPKAWKKSPEDCYNVS